MKKVWFDEAWEDYTYWQMQDKKTLKRINVLLKDIERGNFDGIGKPEPLKGDMSGFWSRRIDDVNRLVYRIRGDVVEIVSCKGPRWKSPTRRRFSACNGLFTGKGWFGTGGVTESSRVKYLKRMSNTRSAYWVGKSVTACFGKSMPRGGLSCTA